MEVKTGLVVKAVAGRDLGKFFVIIKHDDSFAYIADGKTRKIDSAKKKNIKHLRITKTVIDIENLTDKKLRDTLKQFYKN